MTFVNNNTGGLGTNTYYEVRWFEADGGSSSARFGIDKAQDAKQFRKTKRDEGVEANLVVVSVVEVLAP